MIHNRILIFFHFFLFLFIISVSIIKAQENDSEDNNYNNRDMSLFDIRDPLHFQNTLIGNLGWIKIDNDNHIGLRLQPEFVLGKK